MKKSILIAGSVTAAAGTATAIAVPIALTSGNSEAVDDTVIVDPTEPYIVVENVTSSERYNKPGQETTENFYTKTFNGVSTAPGDSAEVDVELVLQPYAVEFDVTSCGQNDEKIQFSSKFFGGVGVDKEIDCMEGHHEIWLTTNMYTTTTFDVFVTEYNVDGVNQFRLAPNTPNKGTYSYTQGNTLLINPFYNYTVSINGSDEVTYLNQLDIS